MNESIILKCIGLNYYIGDILFYKITHPYQHYRNSTIIAITIKGIAKSNTFIKTFN